MSGLAGSKVILAIELPDGASLQEGYGSNVAKGLPKTVKNNTKELYEKKL